MSLCRLVGCQDLMEDVGSRVSKHDNLLTVVTYPPDYKSLPRRSRTARYKGSRDDQVASMSSDVQYVLVSKTSWNAINNCTVDHGFLVYTVLRSPEMCLYHLRGTLFTRTVLCYHGICCLCMSLHPLVCLPNKSGVLSKWLNIGSQTQCDTIAQGL